MKEAFIDKNLAVEIRNSPRPNPGPGEVLIRVVVSGTNPKDWKMPKLFIKGEPSNQGDDIAGYIEAVGQGVTGFHKGDKVAALHQMLAPHGSFAEFAVAWATSTFHLPAALSFEEAATIPLAGMTAALGLYQRLQLPLPWRPAKTRLPLIIYGGATAVGAFAIKLAKLSNIHPIIAVAGRGIPTVERLLDPTKDDVVIDYRNGDDHVVRELSKAAAGGCMHAFDTVSEKSSTTNIGKVLAPGGVIATTQTDDMTGSKSDPNGATVIWTSIPSVHGEKQELQGDREFGAVFFHYIGLALADDLLRGHPYQVVPGGLDGLENALKILESNQLSATKLVLRINETSGVSSS